MVTDMTNTKTQFKGKEMRTSSTKFETANVAEENEVRHFKPSGYFGFELDIEYKITPNVAKVLMSRMTKGWEKVELSENETELVRAVETQVCMDKESPNSVISFLAQFLPKKSKSNSIR